MVDMRVRNDNLAQGQAVFLKPGENFGDVSGIDDDGFVRNLVAQDGAVASQWTHGKAFKDHSLNHWQARRFTLGRGRWVQCGHAYFRGGRCFAGLVCAGSAALPDSGPIACPGLAMLGAVITYFSFFTILTKFLVALVFSAIALRPSSWPGAVSFAVFLVQAATTVYTAAPSGFVYQFAAAPTMESPRLGAWVADFLLHSVVPAGYVLYWLLFAPRTGLRWKDAVQWLAYPGVYLVYVLVRGAVSGFYPYPFVDVKVLGYGRVAAHAAVLMLLFRGMGLLVVAVARWDEEGDPSLVEPKAI